MSRINFTILVMAAVLLTFVGCKKDGVYNPKKKISRIFEENDDSDGRQLRETWTWNENLLDRITNGRDFIMFEYDGKQLKTVRSSWGDRLEFTYDGRKVKEVCVYDGADLETTATFTHKGSKISKITITSIENYDDEDDHYYESFKFLPINKMFPQTQLAKDLAKPKVKGMTKSTSSETITLTWDGQNVKKAVWEYYSGDDLESYTYRYAYDQKINPYYCSLSVFLIDNHYSYLSKNNVIQEIRTDLEGEYLETTYTYTYDGNFPTQQKQFDGECYYITYFEYQ